MEQTPNPERLRPFADEIMQIDFLSHCGEKPLPEYPFPAKYCARSAAMTKVRGIKWENIQISAAGDLTENLCLYHRPYYDSYYNSLVISLKERYISRWQEIVQPIAEARFGKDAEKVTASMRWDIIQILIGRYYEEFFAQKLYPDLLTVYKSGHLPVGWNGAYPDGALLVY